MPGRQFFSHNSPWSNKPSAIGEDGWQIRANGPSCSGEEALASLTSYYPTRRMDSVLNPHTWKSAAALRGTYASVKVAGMKQSRSGLVQGFVTKCAAAGMSDEQILEAAYKAVSLHPSIASEFRPHGIEKQSFDLKPPGASASPLKLPSAAGAPPAPPPTPAATVRPPAAPHAPAAAPQPSMSPFDMPATPNPSNVRPAGPAGYKPPPQRNSLGQGMMNAGNVLAGGTTALAGGLGTLGGGLGMVGSRMTDGVGLTQGWADGADKFTGNMMDAVHSGAATGYGGLTNQDPQQVAWNMRQGGYANAKPLDQMRQDHMRQLNEGPGVGPLSGSQAGGAYSLLNSIGDTSGQMAVTNAGMGGRAGMGMAAVMGTPGQVPGALTNAMFDAPTMSQIPGQMIQNMPAYQEGATHPDQVTSFSPGENNIQANMHSGASAPVDQVGENGRGPATLADGRSPLPEGESVITQWPQYADINNMVKQAPEQARQMADQAVEKLKGMFSSPNGNAQLANVSKTGQLSPDAQAQAATALTSKGYDGKQAMGIISKMNGWEQLGLWGGIGLAGVGLLHAMSGGGGIGSIIMALMGLGTAGFTAGHAGLLDQGAKDLTHGISNAASQATGPQQPQGNMMQAIKPMLPGILDSASPGMMTPMLQQLATMQPDIAKQLDQAAGVGSWGNQAMGMMGSLTGMRQNKMQEQLGLDGPHQEKLLDLWRKSRAQQGGQQ